MSSYINPPVIPMKTKDWIMVNIPVIQCECIQADENIHHQKCLNAKLCNVCQRNLSVPVYVLQKHPLCCKPKMKLL